MIQEYSTWLKESQDNFLHLLTAQQRDWCNAHIVSEWKVNKRGEVYTLDGNVSFENRSFLRFEVQFADIEGYFDCERCPNLISLHGSPKKVDSYFDCSHCPKLASLEGGPEEVGGDYYSHDCLNLTSLKGAPEYINDSFLCYKSPKLLSLEGAPREVSDRFDFDSCPKLNPKEVKLAKDEKLFKIWLKAGTPPIDEFLDPKGKWRGAITGTKFGV